MWTIKEKEMSSVSPRFLAWATGLMIVSSMKMGTQ